MGACQEQQTRLALTFESEHVPVTGTALIWLSVDQGSNRQESLPELDVSMDMVLEVQVPL